MDDLISRQAAIDALQIYLSIVKVFKHVSFFDFEELEEIDDYRIQQCGDGWEYCNRKCTECPKTHIVTTNRISK